MNFSRIAQRAANSTSAVRCAGTNQGSKAPTPGGRPHPTSVVAAMLRTDGLRLVRDRFLLGTISFVLVVAASLRFVIPWLNQELIARFSFDLSQWYPLLVGYFAQVQAALLVGMAGGFLLLETKTQQTARALLVAPIPLAVYLGVLGAALTLSAAALAIVQALILGIGLPGPLALVTTSLAGAPAAVFVALFIGTSASNEVEAFAQMKFLSAAGLVPVAAWFAPQGYQWLGGLYPPYWAVRGFWLAEAGRTSWPLSALAGFVATLVLSVFMARVFVRRAAGT